jgi:serine/threonine protein kinase
MDGRLGLVKNTVLGDSYRIERVIGSGGFGITYAAEDIHLGTIVAIKEYCPEEFGTRDERMRVRPKSERQKITFEWGLRSFLQEARTLARFRHPAIVRVTRVLEAHSTAYMVMDFEQGQDFETWLRGLERSPTQAELDRIAGPLLDALEMMHAQSFLHRDIAPDNIIVRADGTPVLLDFGAARQAVAEKSLALTGIVKTGYSPFEQYATDARLQGPWTDLYSLGATLYRAVAGRPPEEATLRVANDQLASADMVAKGSYRSSFLSAIDDCLKVRPADRPQSVAQLRPMLLAPAHVTAPRAETRKTGTTKPTSVSPARRSMTLWWAVAAMIAVVASGALGGHRYVRWHAEEPGRAAAVAPQGRRRTSRDGVARMCGRAGRVTRGCLAMGKALNLCLLLDDDLTLCGSCRLPSRSRLTRRRS